MTVRPSLSRTNNVSPLALSNVATGRRSISNAVPAGLMTSPVGTTTPPLTRSPTLTVVDMPAAATPAMAVMATKGAIPGIDGFMHPL